MNARIIMKRAVPLLAVCASLILSVLACSAPLEPVRPAPLTTTPTEATAATGQRLPSATPAPPGPAATQETTAAPEVGEVDIYLVAIGDNGASGDQVGCGDSLVPVKRTIEPTRQPVAAALRQLFAIKEQVLGQSGLYNALYQSDLSVASAEVDPTGLAVVSIVGKVQMGGECDIPRFKGQIERTILGVSGVRRTDIFLNGQPIDQALSLR